MENIFQRIFASIRTPVIKAEEEELVDPQGVLREECREKHCTALQELYDKCNKRVQSKQNTTESCVEELFDLMGCIDHCVAHTLFTKLK